VQKSLLKRVEGGLMTNFQEGPSELIWERTSSYKALPDLATAKAVKATVADIIKFAVSDKKNMSTVLSLGTGSGDIYKNQLRREIEERKLRVFGIEHDSFLIKRCREDFPGSYMEASFFYSLEDRYSTVMHRNLLAPLDINDGSVDIIESRFSLHALLFQKQILTLLERLEKVLNPSGGTLIISSIDSWIGSYIEKKLSTLQRFYSDVALDPEKAVISGKKLKRVEFPILDQTNHSDQDALKALVKVSLEPLKAEGRKTSMPGWEEITNADYGDGLKGRLWYRTKEEWVELIRQVFGNKISIKIITPQEIKNLYSDVLDNPFLIMVTK
jgi:ubiquinone/menaquinone biosynthesis C-methylase UbiE